jgi:hypothetical protein
MVVPVGDVDVSGIVDRDAVGLIEAGARRRAAAIPGIAGLAAAGPGRDHARARIDAPDAVVEGVRKVEVPARVEADIERSVQQSPRSWPAIAGVALLAGTDHCRNNPGLLRHRLETPFRGARF